MPAIELRRGAGMGQFLDPPGSPQRDYEVWDWGTKRSRQGEPQGFMSLKGALEAEYVPDTVKARIRELFAAAPIEATEEWLRECYRYWRHCYVPEDGSRDVRSLIIDHEDSLPAERHGAVAAIREWFPDHEPREDLIADPQ